MAKTKKQLREDHFIELLYNGMEKIRPHVNLLLAVIVVAVVSVGIWLTLSLRRESHEERALSALWQSETVEQLQDLPPSYLKTSVGPMILLKLAQKLQEQDGAAHREQLVQVYQHLLELEPSDYCKLQAHIALGKLRLENLQYEAALKDFQAAQDLPLTFRRAEAIWYKAWCLEKLGRPAEALEAYRNVRDYPELRSQFWRQEAAYRIAQLERL